MSSPAPIHIDVDASSSNPFLDINSRPMKVKVLYTFDEENLTNCLARVSEVHKIPTVPIDDNTQIGLIELRHCVRAVVAASPELISRLGQGDFTIYAYDYSEYQSPLVGQGMLSTILAAFSPTPTAPAHQSKTMVTGRVCKNIMGLFTNGISETLEVKLRLVPVPKPVESEYVKSMELYRNMSPAMSGAFDPKQWLEGLNDDSLVANLEQQSQTFAVTAPIQQYQHHRNMSNASTQGRPVGLSRQATQISRPSSRTSVRSDHQPRIKTEPGALDTGMEDGPARKRAKITQTDWKGKSTFGGNTDSLRVAASTAASIRVHKPVATRPSFINGHNLEPPPRVPTPVAHSKDSSRFRLKGQQNSFLRRESSLYQAQTPQSPFDNQSEAIMSSPEDTGDQTNELSPLDFPSSPPPMPDPSSPGMQALQRPLDSGYMSGGALEFLLDDDDRTSQAADLRKTSGKPKGRPAPPLPADRFIEQTPGPPELLPTRMNMHKYSNDKGRSNSLALPTKPSLTSQSTSCSDSAMGSYQLMDPHGLLDHSSYSRAPSCIPSRESAASPAPSEDIAFGGKPRSGSGAKRKKLIQERLLKSLASGDMPTYCYNCGAIETPTWRSLYIMTIDGTPAEEDYLEIEGETRSVEILEKDPSDKITKYRIVKTVRKTKDKDQRDMLGFDCIQVCNPCGLWFNKFKYMRPEEKWSRGPKIARKRRGKSANLQSDMLEPPSDFPHSDFPQSEFWTDQIDQDGTTPAVQEKASPDAMPEDANAEEPQDDVKHSDHRPPLRPRANSMQPTNCSKLQSAPWSNTELDAALQRAIQSSPARFLGTQESPIELEDDLTPKPTRRLLFPSPRKDGEMKSLDDSCMHIGHGAATKSNTISPSSDPFINMAFTSGDKENLPPLLSSEDISGLFDYSPFKTPSKVRSGGGKSTPPSVSTAQFDALFATPTPIRRSMNQNSRTPSRAMDAFLPSFSSAERRELLHTPSRYMALNLTSPTRSVSGPMTPFTRHLSQLMSDPSLNGANIINGAGAHDPSGTGSSSSPSIDFPDFTEMTPGTIAGLFSPATAQGLGLARPDRGVSSPMRALDFGLSSSASD